MNKKNSVYLPEIDRKLLYSNPIFLTKGGDVLLDEIKHVKPVYVSWLLLRQYYKYPKSSRNDLRDYIQKITGPDNLPI